MYHAMSAGITRRDFCRGAAAGLATLAVAPSFAAGGRPVRTPLLLDAKRMAVWDGPGIRTTFFVKGCPLRCVWCHNPESVEPQRQTARFQHLCIHCAKCTMDEATCPTRALKFYGQEWTTEALVAKALEDKSFYDRSGGGVTLSGGEPLFFWEWAADFLGRLKTAGLHTCLDTSLYAPQAAIEALLPVVDMWLPDYKAHDDALHQRFTGVPNGMIRRNLERLVAAKAKLEVRCLVVPGCTDGADLKARHDYLGSLGIAGDQIVDLEYFDYARSKYQALGLKDTMPPKPAS